MRTVTILSLTLIGLAAPSSRSNAADPLAAKRREARKLAASIEATSDQLSLLNEEFLVSRERLKKLTKTLNQAQSDASAVQTRLLGLQARIRRQALNVYVRPALGNDGVLESSQDLGEWERRRVLEDRSISGGRDAEDALAAVLEDIERKQVAVASAKARADRESKALVAKREAADKLLVKLDALERRTKGELAALVAQAERDAAAAEARREREALARRQREARAELERRRSALEDRLRRGTSAGAGGSGNGAFDTLPAVARSAAGSSAPRARSLSELEADAGTAPAVASSPGASNAVRLALAQLGKPYIWGAEGPSGFDCSGLMLYAWRQSGGSLPRTSRAQYSATRRVSMSQIQPGDLVFFGRPIHHVGMYIGDGKMVEASRRGVPVRVRSVYRRDMVGVGRVR